MQLIELKIETTHPDDYLLMNLSDQSLKRGTAEGWKAIGADFRLTDNMIDWGAVDEELRTILYTTTNCHIPDKAMGALRALLRRVSGQ